MSSTSAKELRWDKDVPLPNPRSNRPITFGHRVEAFIAKSALAILGKMNVDKASRRMGGVLRNIGPLLRSVHQRGHTNLKLIYPDMTAAERAAILRGCWTNLGRVTAEFAHMGQLADRVRIENADLLDPYLNGEKKAVFFSGHFANWEVMAITLQAYGIRYGVVFRSANNPIVDAEIIRLRSAEMSRFQIPKGKKGSRELLRAMNEGLCLCTLVDQKMNEGESVPFLGHPAMTAVTPARLSLREDIPLIPLQLIRENGVNFTMRVHEPLEIEKTGDLRADTLQLTEAINEKIGDFVLEHPEQWLWLHRRWPKNVTGS